MSIFGKFEKSYERGLYYIDKKDYNQAIIDCHKGLEELAREVSIYSCAESSRTEGFDIPRLKFDIPLTLSFFLISIATAYTKNKAFKKALFFIHKFYE